MAKPTTTRVFLTAGLIVGPILGAIALMATLDPWRALLVGVVSFLVAGAAFTLAARGG